MSEIVKVEGRAKKVSAIPGGYKPLKRFVTSNKQGQQLGPKGQATRLRIVEAAEKLLLTQSPVDLTAVAIAKAANTSPASFYMYFEDIREVLFALSDIATQEMDDVLGILEDEWREDNLDSWANSLVDAFYAVWDRHREVLRYRNMESDRGDPAFDKLRNEGSFPFIEALASRIVAACAAGQMPSRGDARALATVLHAGIERLAAVDPEVTQGMLGVKRLKAAQARAIVCVIVSTRLSFTALPKD
ncbi:TetR/AcrR family transcriptional regulator [Pseudomonas sp. BF-R-19]|uniref:TetR/AcrR family transcriptional regulator n=1 Tax=Pseudomonas sp. BF-R-19 TaxID=2832397 RepID=UPI001CC01770|nr:TetR/AcrR family transcriptional regulator [Pseudomonas sp. BF-R-19]